MPTPSTRATIPPIDMHPRPLWTPIKEPVGIPAEKPVHNPVDPYAVQLWIASNDLWRAACDVRGKWTRSTAAADAVAQQFLNLAVAFGFLGLQLFQLRRAALWPGPDLIASNGRACCTGIPGRNSSDRLGL